MWILAKLLAIITRQSRYFPDFNWNKLWTYNAFRVYEAIFGRRYGVRIETSVACDSEGNTLIKCYSLESVVVHTEVAIRNFFKGLVPSRIYVPAFTTPQGIFIPQPYLLAIAYDAASNRAGSTTSPITWTHTVTGSNPYLYLSSENQVGSGGSQDVTAASYNSVDMTPEVGHVDFSTGQNGWLQFFDLVNPATGANTVSVSFSSANPHDGMSTSFSGAAQSGQPDNFSGETLTATASPVVNITVNTDQSALICHASDGYGKVKTPGANTTMGLDPRTGEQTSFYTLAQSTGAQTMTFTTVGTATYLTGTTSIKPPSVTSSPPIVPQIITW